MIFRDTILFPTIERSCEMFYRPRNDSYNTHIGTFIEQRNDDDERMFIFDIHFDAIPTEEWKRVNIPGINLLKQEYPYVRCGELPCYLCEQTPPPHRDDLKYTLKWFKMDHYDDWELLLQSRGYLCSNVYLGVDCNDMYYGTMSRDIVPRDLVPVNIFHPITIQRYRIENDVLIWDKPFTPYPIDLT